MQDTPWELKSLWLFLMPHVNVLSDHLPLSPKDGMLLLPYSKFYFIMNFRIFSPTFQSNSNSKVKQIIFLFFY